MNDKFNLLLFHSCRLIGNIVDPIQLIMCLLKQSESYEPYAILCVKLSATNTNKKKKVKHRVNQTESI